MNRDIENCKMDADDKQRAEEIADADEERIPDHVKRRIPEPCLEREDKGERREIGDEQRNEAGEAERTGDAGDAQMRENIPVRTESGAGSRHNKANRRAATEVFLESTEEGRRDTGILVPCHPECDCVERACGRADRKDRKRRDKPENIQPERVAELADEIHDGVIGIK